MINSFDSDYVISKLNNSFARNKSAVESYSRTLDNLYRLIQTHEYANQNSRSDELVKSRLKLSSSILSLQMVNQIQNKKITLLNLLSGCFNKGRTK